MLKQENIYLVTVGGQIFDNFLNQLELFLKKLKISLPRAAFPHYT